VVVQVREAVEAGEARPQSTLRDPELRRALQERMLDHLRLAPTPYRASQLVLFVGVGHRRSTT
jgi:hypothetical protein